MKTTMIINRLENWFVYEDVYNDPFYAAILLLEKLIGRPKMGLLYKRIELISSVMDQKSQKSLETVDKAILLLSTRSLIRIEPKGDSIDSCLFITDKGIEALKVFREEFKHVSSKNKSKGKTRTRTRI